MNENTPEVMHNLAEMWEQQVRLRRDPDVSAAKLRIIVKLFELAQRLLHEYWRSNVLN